MKVMKAQAITSTLILVAVIALVVGAAVGYFVAPSKVVEKELPSQMNQDFTVSESSLKEQVRYLNDYLSEMASLTGQQAPEIEYSSANYDSSLGLIVVNGKEKTSGQQVTMYFTKDYRFVGYQEPINLKSLVDEVKKQKQAQEQQPQGDVQSIIDSLPEGAPYQGSEDAPVVMVVFDDFQCPFCEKFFKETLPQLRQEYIDTGKVKFVFKHFPLSFHQYAEKASEAAECANEQGKFWEMHDKIYENQDAITVEDLKKYAQELGLDTEQFNECLDSGKYADKVSSDFNTGVQLGVSGTPTFFINGEKLVGAQPYSVFKQVIDSKLQQSQSN